MPRVTNKAVAAQRQDARAPFLFDESNLPMNQEWLVAVKEKRYEFTGASITDDELKVQRMVDLLCLGNGVKKVAKAMGVSPHTVRAARGILVDQGKLAPFKLRAISRMEEFFEDGLEKLHEAVASGKLHPNFMSSALGIVFDKRALALGEPTQISVGTTVKLQPEALSVKALNEWAADLESSGKAPESKEITATATVDAGSDAGEPVPGGNSEGQRP